MIRKALIQISSGLSGFVTNLIVLPDGWPLVENPWMTPAGFKVIDPVENTKVGDFWDSDQGKFRDLAAEAAAAQAQNG